MVHVADFALILSDLIKLVRDARFWDVIGYPI
jgi:hypothetical protein